MEEVEVLPPPMFRNMSERRMEMRQVKCRNCGTFINRDSAISVQNGKAKLWYCDSSCLEQATKNALEAAKKKEEYDSIFEETKVIFGYDFQGYSLLKKEVQNWEKLANRNKILNYLKENENYLSSILAKKEFANDYNRIRYYSVIVSSKLHDYQGKTEEKVVPKVDMIFYEPSQTSNNKRRSLEDLEDEF